MRIAAMLPAAAAWMFLSAAAGAQNAPAPNPADSSVPVPTVRYESAFSDYQRHRDQPPRDWIGVNDEMRRLGSPGHPGDHSPRSAAHANDPEFPGARGPAAGAPHPGGGHR